jgi:hypothetical protein
VLNIFAEIKNSTKKAFSPFAVYQNFFSIILMASMKLDLTSLVIVDALIQRRKINDNFLYSFE